VSWRANAVPAVRQSEIVASSTGYVGEVDVSRIPSPLRASAAVVLGLTMRDNAESGAVREFAAALTSPLEMACSVVLIDIGWAGAFAKATREDVVASNLVEVAELCLSGPGVRSFPDNRVRDRVP